MKIMIHLAHPAHFQMTKLVVNELENIGVSVVISYNDKDVLHDLVKSFGFKCPVYRVKLNDKRSLFWKFFSKLYGIFKIVQKEKPSLLVGTTVALAHVGFVLRVKNIIVNEDDFEIIKKTGIIGYPFASKIVTPVGCSTGKFESKTIRYNGYHELAYLHPDHFVPNAKVLRENNLESNNYILLRFSALNAHHDTGVQGIDDEFAIELINQVKSRYKVIITSERLLNPALEPYRMTFHPSQMHDVLAYAKMFIGDSQTMAAESMVLGRPSIRCNDFVGKLAYLEELENHYKLGFGVLPSKRKDILKIVEDIISTDTIEEIWAERRKIMLSEKINVAQYWTQLFIELASK